MASGIWLIVDSKYASDGVLVQVEPKCLIDLLGYARATISGITPFHLDNGFDEFP